MRTKAVPMCTLTPDFPDIGYAPVVTFADEAMEFSAIYPLELIHSTPEASALYAADSIPRIEADNPGYIALEYITVFPLIFDRLYELKPGFWQKPDIEYYQPERAQLFVKIAKLPRAYHMLVTPGYYRRRMWQLAAALPFPKTMDVDVLEQFMLRSNWPVERRAKYSAIYSVRNPLHINWVTGKIATNIREL